MSIIHTQPTQTAGIKERKLYLVPSGGTQSADSVLLVDVISVKWMVALKNQASKETCAYEVIATYDESINSIGYNIHNIVGTPLPNITNVTIMGGTHMVIEITNNSVNSIEIRICKHVLEL